MKAKNLSAVLFMTLFAVSVGGGLVSARAESPQNDVKTAPVKEALKKGFPHLQALSINETPIKGLYEVEAGTNIIYFYPEKDLLVFGEIWTKDGTNITAEKKTQLAAAKLRDMPLDKAIKIGNGRNTVIEFTDPDCPYCRKASAFFKGRGDVTLYVFFFPLPIHKEAEAHARHVLCARDKSLALEEVISGQLDGKGVPACNDPKADALLWEHKELGNKLGVRGTPAFWINGQYVTGANIPAIESLLNQTVANHVKQ
jgi:thiol:disulfide interchange protein DsbC